MVSHTYCPACAARQQWTDLGLTEKEIMEFDAEIDAGILAKGKKPRVLLIGDEGLRIREAIETATLVEKQEPNLIVIDTQEREMSRRL